MANTSRGGHGGAYIQLSMGSTLTTPPTTAAATTPTTITNIISAHAFLAPSVGICDFETARPQPHMDITQGDHTNHTDHTGTPHKPHRPHREDHTDHTDHTGEPHRPHRGTTQPDQTAQGNHTDHTREPHKPHRGTTQTTHGCTQSFSHTCGLVKASVFTPAPSVKQTPINLPWCFFDATNRAYERQTALVKACTCKGMQLFRGSMKDACGDMEHLSRIWLLQ